jgi:hypothetical protein
VRGTFTTGEAVSYGVQKLTLEDWVVAESTTEFSLPQMGVYTVVDLATSQ